MSPAPSAGWFWAENASGRLAYLGFTSYAAIMPQMPQLRPLPPSLLSSLGHYGTHLVLTFGRTLAVLAVEQLNIARKLLSEAAAVVVMPIIVLSVASALL